MRRITLNENIIADPEICHGQPVFKGTRIMVWQVLELLEGMSSSEDIYKLYPSLPANSVESALKLAAEKVKELSYVPLITTKEVS